MKWIKVQNFKSSEFTLCFEKIIYVQFIDLDDLFGIAKWVKISLVYTYSLWADINDSWLLSKTVFPTSEKLHNKIAITIVIMFRDCSYMIIDV